MSWKAVVILFQMPMQSKKPGSPFQRKLGLLRKANSLNQHHLAQH